MSKHHNNYTNYSKFNAAEVEPAVREAVEAPVEPETDDNMIPVADVIDQVINEELGNVEPEVAPPVEPKTGIVTATKLNIRKLPVAGAQVLAVVDQNATLMIEPDYETVEWIKVYTETGIEGYCMKKFVTIK